MSQRSSKKSRRSRRKMGSSNIDKFGFADCPTGGAVVIKTRKGNRLYVFDSIDFMATDTKGKCFEVEGLSFDQEKGWFDANIIFTKYYGKNVYEACLEYAVDIAIRDNLYLGLAIFGKQRSAKVFLRVSHSKITERLEKEYGYTVVIKDGKGNRVVA